MSVIDNLEGQKKAYAAITDMINDTIRVFKEVDQKNKENIIEAEIKQDKLPLFWGKGYEQGLDALFRQLKSMQDFIKRANDRLDDATAYELYCMEEDCVHH